MIAAKPHVRESERLEELASYSIMDTLEEEDYDNLTSIAASICQTSISLISLVDDKRQWFKSHHGLDVSETQKDFAFCAHAINTEKVFFEIQDARQDDRFADNPLVTGEPQIVFYAGVPLMGDDNLPLGTLCVIDRKPHSLSDNQKASLKALSRQVMNLIQLRRRNIQLRETLNELKEINHNLERFAMAAAHDLKSPLNNISVLTEMFKDLYKSTLDQNGSDLLELISNSSDKLKSLIDGLLQYSKSDSLTKEDKSTIEPSDFVKDIFDLLSKPESTKLEMKSKLKEIQVNKTVLYHVLTNLMSNAIKYNPKDEPKICVSIDDTGKQYYFEVIDNGIGIPKEAYGTIFEMFRILQTADVSGEKGNGIGLAMVKKLIQGSGGSISVESELGEGTTFKFSLPK